MKPHLLLLLLLLWGLHDADAQTPMPKPATTYTKRANEAWYGYLDFTDSLDFIDASKGLIATYKHPTIGGSYSFEEFDFIKGKSPETVHPSLWRQSGLNAMSGLFKVTDDIYQVRGFDLANMTLIKSQTGWIVIDPLTVRETAEAAMSMVREHLGEYPVKAVIITHSHIDHFGGMRAVVNEEDVSVGRIKIYVPSGFMEHAVSENVMAGSAMRRRAMYMYGNLLGKQKTGSLGSGLGTTTARGVSGILDATHVIEEENGVVKTIDGVQVEFIYTPDSEAPAEMMLYLPDYKTLIQAENINHTLHNLYTLRGAQVRNGQKWSAYIDKVITKWGHEVEVSLGVHHWPTWGNQSILTLLEDQRDLYRFIHDQTLRMANNGLTPLEIADQLKLPKGLDTKFYNRPYYGTVSHNVRAQYQLYFGFFDGNPSNLNPLPPTEAGLRFVEMMGGSENALARAREYYDKGDYRWVAEVVNHVVFAEPENRPARDLLADAYEQMGYQAESAPWRNFYLTGAQELRYGKKTSDLSGSANPDVLRAMSSELFFNYLAMRYKGTDESADKDNFNIYLTDTKEWVGLVVSNGTVHPRINSVIPSDVTATITAPRTALMALSSAVSDLTLNQLIEKGIVQISGDKSAFEKFLADLDTFDTWFNIIEP